MKENLSNKDKEEYSGIQFNTLDDMGIDSITITPLSDEDAALLDNDITLLDEDMSKSEDMPNMNRDISSFPIEDSEDKDSDLIKKTEDNKDEDSDIIFEDSSRRKIKANSEDEKYLLDYDEENMSKGNVIPGYEFTDVSDLEQIEDNNEKEDDSEINDDVDFISDDIATFVTKEYSQDSVKKKKNNKNTTKIKRIIRIASVAVVSFVVVFFTLAIILKQVVESKMNFTDFSDTVEQEEQFDTENTLGQSAKVVKAEEFNWNMISGNPKYDENIYNILLVGGDIAGKKDARGNSDTLIIVSIDKNTKKLKMTSIMRDTYVPIPNHRDNKINSAYATGGVPLIKQTIEDNFKITIDSTVVVNYSTFKKAIDKLGGVDDVKLNKKEAKFINSECRKKGVTSNLTEGTFNLNATQALHFARIRKIHSDIYGDDDFGRTARQRFVINQLFKKYKDLSYAELAGVATEVMGELEVDEVLKKDLFLLLQVALKFDTDSLEEFRLPMDDKFSFASVPAPGSSRNMSVVKIDDHWKENVDGLHEFIYGDTDY